MGANAISILGATMRKCVVGFVLLLSSSSVFSQQYDILIRNGRVVDGTGNPWVYADVGVTGDRISLVGRAPAHATAKQVIDAQRLIGAPGRRARPHGTTGGAGDAASCDGCFHFLIYAPAFYAKTEELIALAKAASKYGGIYASHIRNEGDHEMEALEEAFRIGREAKIPVEIWHLKVAGRQNWGQMPNVIAVIEAARASGLDVTANQYSYTASGTSLGATIPPKYHEDGSTAFVTRLQNPQVRAAIRQELAGVGGNIENMWRGTGRPPGILGPSVVGAMFKHCQSQTTSQIAPH